MILGALAALQAEAGRPGLLFVDGHQDAWPPRASPTGEAADCELGLALRLFDAGLSLQLRVVLPRIDPADVAAVGPRDTAELAAAGVASLDGQLGALIRPAGLTADRYAAALAGLPPPWWLHTGLDVLAAGELAAVDYPQPGGLTWRQLTGLTATALTTDGCAGWSVCIYNPDLDPGATAPTPSSATSAKRSLPAISQRAEAACCPPLGAAIDFMPIIREGMQIGEFCVAADIAMSAPPVQGCPWVRWRNRR